MKQIATILFFAISITSISLLHAAASSSSSASPATKKRRTVSFSTNHSGAQIPQKPALNFALIGNDAACDPSNIALIDSEVAAEYSSTFHTNLQAYIALRELGLTLGSTQEINIDAPNRLALAFTTIMNKAHQQKQSMQTVSAWKLSKESDITDQMKNFMLENYQQLCSLLQMYEAKPIVTDTVAIFILQYLSLKNIISAMHSLFNKYSLIKSALAKQLFLSYFLYKEHIPAEWRWENLLSHERFGLSVQDLADHDHIKESTTLSETERGVVVSFLDISGREVDDLTGIQHLPYTDRIKVLTLSKNRISCIAPRTLACFVNLEKLNLIGSFDDDLTIAPKSLTGLTALKILNVINWKSLNVTPGSFAKHPNLSVLNLSCSNITAISSSMFAKLTKLQTLYLINNKITSIAPNAFTDLVNLRELHLGGNQISLDEQARIEKEVKAASLHTKIYWQTPYASNNTN